MTIGGKESLVYEFDPDYVEVLIYCNQDDINKEWNDLDIIKQHQIITKILEHEQG